MRGGTPVGPGRRQALGAYVRKPRGVRRLVGIRAQEVVSPEVAVEQGVDAQLRTRRATHGGLRAGRAPRKSGPALRPASKRTDAKLSAPEGHGASPARLEPVQRMWASTQARIKARSEARSVAPHLYRDGDLCVRTLAIDQRIKRIVLRSQKYEGGERPFAVRFDSQVDVRFRFLETNFARISRVGSQLNVWSVPR